MPDKDTKLKDSKLAKEKKIVEDELVYILTKNEEDRFLKEKINLLVEQSQSQDLAIASEALRNLSQEVKSSTTTMTSIPKPFKFLKEHYPILKSYYEKLCKLIKIVLSTFKQSFADFLSVLAMVFDENGKTLELYFQGTRKDVLTWGFEYLNYISGEISREYERRYEQGEPVDDIMILVQEIIPYFMEHSSEVVALDLLLEVDRLDMVLAYINPHNYNRIVGYLNNCALYGVDSQETQKTFKISTYLIIGYQICLSQKQYASALKLALKLNSRELINNVIQVCEDRDIKKQLAFDLARQRIPYEFEDEELKNIASNSLLTQYYNKLAKELEISEPKHPDQIYKTFLEDKKGSTIIDSAKGNLANTYVNAFVNIASGKDSLMLQRKEGEAAWIFKVKNEGLIAATASLGLIFQYDPENGSINTSEYMDLQDGFSKAGANIAIGLYSQGIQDENETAKALLEEQILSKDEHSRFGAIIGLGMAYAGTNREDLLELLMPIITDPSLSCETCAFASLSLSQIFIGQLHEDALSAIIETIMYRSDSERDQTVSRYFAVALGLLCMGQQENCEPTLDAIRTISHPLAKYADILIQGCAYLGSGNVMKIQEMLHQCLDTPEEKNTTYKGVAVLSMALIAMRDPIGSDMLLRSLNHILQFGDQSTRRAVPLAIALLSVSDPKITLQDLLNKLAYESDDELAQRSIMALGLIGCGTNNSRLAGILRSLASYYSLESTSNHLFCVRIAQGLLHTGKVRFIYQGLMTLQPFYADNFLQSNSGLSGLLTAMNSFLDMENIINGKYHYTIYYLSLCLYPRMCTIVDENLNSVSVQVRVGQALDTVGQAGNPKRITGFQTHSSPVVISAGERAEFANEEYLPVTNSILENIVVVKKNLNYQLEQNITKKKKS